MNDAFRIDRHVLNETLKRGIRHVQDHTSMSYRELGLLLGYTSRHPGGVVQLVMSRPDVLPGPLPLLRASRLFSRYDFDHVSDLFSCQGKRTLPVPTSFTLNGTLDDEVADNTEAIGQAIAAFRFGHYDEAARFAKQGIGVLFRLLAEIDARQSGDPLPTGDVLPQESITFAADAGG